MKKSDLAALQYEHNQYIQMLNSASEKLVAVIEASFSALATSDPKLAVHVINQLVASKSKIEILIDEREVDQEEFVDDMVTQLPDTLELEEG